MIKIWIFRNLFHVFLKIHIETSLRYIHIGHCKLPKGVLQCFIVDFRYYIYSGSTDKLGLQWSTRRGVTKRSLAALYSGL